MNDNDTYLLSARRTPIGTFLGSLSTVPATALGSTALKAAIESAGIEASSIDEVYMGNVLSAGLGQAPARQASLKAGIPSSVPTTTVSRVCGSGLQSIVLAQRAIASGEAQIVAAGGMENMSQVPHYLEQSRTGTRLGAGKLIDGMIHDGLWDPYNDMHMGLAAEECAKKFNLTRESQDAFAKESYEKALAAIKTGAFQDEIVSVEVPVRKGDPTIVDTDEEPGRGQLEKFGRLRTAFKKDGTITAANASSINDGAAACLLASGRAVREQSLKPIARVVSSGFGAQEPIWFTTAPAFAIEQALKKAGLHASDIDLWEINEAFSCVTQSCAELAQVDLKKVNVHGGAVALGHPIGASGARILTTLVHALKRHNQRFGLATLCIGGGEAVAVVVEAIDSEG